MLYNDFCAGHVFASIAFCFAPPFGGLWLPFGTGDDGARETLSEDGVVIIGGHWVCNSPIVSGTRSLGLSLCAVGIE